MSQQIYLKPSRLFRFVSPVLKPFARKVERTFKLYRSGKGRHYYPCIQMLFLCIWMSLAVKSERSTDRKLEADSMLAMELGFKDATPSQPTISRFIARMGRLI